MVDAVDGIERIRYTSPHPKDMREDVIRAHAELPALCEHIHLPLQSGSSRILKAMRRTYNRERYLDRVALIREHVPDCALTTDIIVGFPGETEDDFERRSRSSSRSATTAPSRSSSRPRRGTEAATLGRPGPARRSSASGWSGSSRRSSAARASAPSASSAGRWRSSSRARAAPTRPALRGRSRHNKTVNFEGTAAPGELVEVEIDGGDLADALRPRAAAQPRRAEPAAGMRVARDLRADRGRQDRRSRSRSPSCCASAARTRSRSPATRSRSTAGLEIAQRRRDAGRAERDSSTGWSGSSAIDERVLGRPLRGARARRDRRACSPPGRRPIVVGGTGLYMRAALAELDLRPPVPVGGPRRGRGGSRRARAGGAARRARARARLGRAPERPQADRPPDRARRGSGSPPTRRSRAALERATCAVPTTLVGLTRRPRRAADADRRAGRRDGAPRSRGGGPQRRRRPAPRARPARRSASRSCSPATSRR